MASNRLSTKKDFQYWMQAAQNNYGSLFITVKTLSELDKDNRNQNRSPAFLQTVKTVSSSGLKQTSSD